MCSTEEKRLTPLRNQYSPDPITTSQLPANPLFSSDRFLQVLIGLGIIVWSRGWAAQTPSISYNKLNPSSIGEFLYIQLLLLSSFTASLEPIKYIYQKLFSLGISAQYHAIWCFPTGKARDLPYYYL